MPEGCVFCGIAAGKIPSKKVYEDSASVAFLDINPRNPGHTLVIPKAHFDTIMDMPEKEAGLLFAGVKRVAAAVKEAAKADGLSVIQSNGKAAGQVVPHVHFHLIPRFENEGPIGLESVLPVKKTDEKAMNSMVDAIKGSVAAGEEEESGDSGGDEEKEEEDEDDINFNF
jgi:histidine triad (HIT) family protein